MANEAISSRQTTGISVPRVTSRRPRINMGRMILYIVAIVTSIIFMLPFVYTILSSLKSPGELYRYPPVWLPDTPHPENYLTVFERVAFARWLLNSAWIASATTIGSVLSAAIVGYSFARFRYPGRNLLFMITMSTMMLPTEVTLIPLYLAFAKLHWLDTYKPLILPSFFGGGAFLIFLMRQFFMTIPMDLDEAARIDGAGYLRVFWQILLPLSVPVLATGAVLTFMGHWNDFMYPFIFLNTKIKFTVAVGIRFFQATAGVDVGEPVEHLLMAAGILMTAPIIVLFFVSQRYFVRGVVMSGIKG
ncbi:MAG: carbohydrate ABC transporter permease [Caldilineaceae bacterium]|nr:carbohydrate ABC transporter permease [Caldilineaceae bacterium]HRJ43993.1 carbohydrate ABC transporter permease [Caldilineaceae bacterium]